MRVVGGRFRYSAEKLFASWSAAKTKALVSVRRQAAISPIPTWNFATDVVGDWRRKTVETREARDTSQRNANRGTLRWGQALFHLVDNVHDFDAWRTRNAADRRGGAIDAERFACRGACRRPTAVSIFAFLVC